MALVKPVAVPAALSRVGIRTVRDNLPAGAGLDVAAAFVQFFRPEIEARAFQAPTAPQETLPCETNSFPS